MKKMRPKTKAKGRSKTKAKVKAKGSARPARPFRPAQPVCDICPVAKECGACSAIELPYAEQLAQKEKTVARLFGPLVGDDCEFRPILGMEEPFSYRNKIASPFAPARGKSRQPHARGASSGPDARGKQGRRGKQAQREIRCGMYAAGTHRIVETEECPVEHPSGRRIIQAVRSLMLRYGVPPYDEDAATGFMRHCVVRVGHESGEVLVTLVTNDPDFKGGRNFARELLKRCPEITTVVQNVNERSTNAILGDRERTLLGPGFILDTLCGLSFRISSHSFYQVNSTQTEVLYRTAIDAALEGGASRGATIVDAYCGTGTIGLAVAARGEDVRVVGVDSVEAAIRDARQNAAHNGIENAEFVVGDAGSFLRRYAAEGRRADVLMMDPPRAGSTEEFLEAAAGLAPERIVYISCNPETQARDATFLCDRGYRLRSIQPVDMFPHTPHVETVVLMSRKDT